MIELFGQGFFTDEVPMLIFGQCLFGTVAGWVLFSIHLTNGTILRTRDWRTVTLTLAAFSLGLIGFPLCAILISGPFAGLVVLAGLGVGSWLRALSTTRPTLP